MAKFIVAIETVKIKEFLFSTNKLKVIRGASYLLDYLNQVEVPKILEKNGITKEERIYVGAGNAKFFVERDSKEEAEQLVKKIISEVKEKYEREAPGVKIVGLYEKYEENSDKKVWDIFDELALETAKVKSKGFPILNIDLPYIEKCETNEDEIAEISAKTLKEDLKKIIEEKRSKSFYFKIEEDSLVYENVMKRKISLDELEYQVTNLAKKTGKISEGTFWKILYSNFVKSYNKNEVGFYKYVKLDKEIDLDNESTIDDFENEDSFIGFMYSDGDGLGDFLKNIKKIFIELDKDKETKQKYNINPEKAYLDFLSEFSKGLDIVTKESLTEVLDKIFSVEKNETKKWGEFLIVGGDDVCAVFDPTLVLKISNEFQKLFEEKMLKLMEKIASGSKNKENTPKKELPDSLKSAIENTKITSSSGVIIAKTKTPMFQLFKQGTKLQKKAKAKRNETKEEGKLATTGFIDFQVIGSEGCVDINSFRDSISNNENNLMERPYSINEISNKKVKTMDSLLEIIYKMKKVKFPKNKLRYIYDLKRTDKLKEYQKKMQLINIISKMSKEHIEFIVDDLKLDYKKQDTFNNNFKNIFDILEISDFIGEKEEKTNEN
ncbi:hypothetical protein JY402_09220 [Fusobacterium polymorphum]|uniref:Cas10/Cmr2 second palm domain-containing protein n=1 Tax=Fusobacterium nucleatum subsp. polymorphum TaxID=76857 RepID=UPI001C6EB0F2|nr:hypothetical protein [Fusobacterium polymorphum]QYR60765.1 hypothetical protein JY402_09220 [Fusobacterium polymorphum]